MNRAILALVAVTLFCSALFAALPHINAWEKANNYPYGKLCDLYRNCGAQ